MADPLSVVASIAGIATASVAISKVIYEIAHTVKHAPKEVAEMAGEMTLLSSVLRHLRSALAECIDSCKPRLITDIRKTVSKIKHLHAEIKDLTKNSTRTLYRVELLFKSARTKTLLAQIEGFKSSVAVMLTTVQLAVAKKQLSMSKGLASKSDVGEIRQLLENLVYSSNDSINQMRRRQRQEARPPEIRIDHRSLTPDWPPPHWTGRQRQAAPKANMPPPPPPPVDRHGRIRANSPEPLDINTSRAKQIRLPGPMLARPDVHSNELSEKKDNRVPDQHDSHKHVSNQYHATVEDENSEEGLENERDYRLKKEGDSNMAGNSPTTIILPKAHDNKKQSSQGAPRVIYVNTNRDTGPQSGGTLGDAQDKTDESFNGDSDDHIEEYSNRYDYSDEDEKDDKGSMRKRGEGRDSWRNIERDISRGRSLSRESWNYIHGPKHVEPGPYADPIQYRTELTHGVSGNKLQEDAASWLYRLVFLEDGQEKTSHNRRPEIMSPNRAEVPRVVDRLLLQWTNAEPSTEDSNISVADEVTMSDPDPAWSHTLQSQIIKLEEIRLPAHDTEMSDFNLSVSSGDNPFVKSDSRTCVHGLLWEYCTDPICGNSYLNRGDQFEPWTDDIYPDPIPSICPHARAWKYCTDPICKSTYRRQLGDQSEPRKHRGSKSRPQEFYPPRSNSRTKEYQFTGVPKGWDGTQYPESLLHMQREKLLLSEINHLETNLRRIEVLNAKEIAHREKMEAQVSKQHDREVRSLEKELLHVKNLEHRNAVKEQQLQTEQMRFREAEAKLNVTKKEASEGKERNNARPEQTCIQISTAVDRNKSWTPLFHTLGLSFERVDTAPAPTGIHGTVCWTRPFLPAVSELYQVLKNQGWEPLWMRGCKSGQTWFLGPTPILVNFFQKDYIPQVGQPSDRAGAPVVVYGTEDEYAAIDLGWADKDAIEESGLPYKGRIGSQHNFSVELTHGDVEVLLATSLLARERRDRKACLEIADRNDTAPVRKTSTSPTTSTPTIRAKRSSRRPSLFGTSKYLRPDDQDRASQSSGSRGSDSRSSGSKKHRRKTSDVTSI